jgi:hypothetical protein
MPMVDPRSSIATGGDQRGVAEVPTKAAQRLDPAALLRNGHYVLSRSDIEGAWAAAAAAHSAVRGNVAQCAEVAAYLLAQILAEIGNTANRPDLVDVAEAVDSLSLYLHSRMVQIVTEMANA